MALPMASVSGPSTARNPSLAKNQTKIPSRPSGPSLSHVVAPFYGHEETAKICARFVTHSFQCSDLLPLSTAVPPAPSPPLANFIAYALHRSKLPPWFAFAALLLLSRLKSRFRSSRACLGNTGHRLFIAVFILASKVICEWTHKNKDWSKITQNMFPLREINQIERSICEHLEWKCGIESNDLKELEANVHRDFKGLGPYPAHYLPSLAPSSMSCVMPYKTQTGNPAPNPSDGQRSEEPLSNLSGSSRSTRRYTTPTPSATSSAHTSHMRAFHMHPPEPLLTSSPRSISPPRPVHRDGPPSHTLSSSNGPSRSHTTPTASAAFSARTSTMPHTARMPAYATRPPEPPLTSSPQSISPPRPVNHGPPSRSFDRSRRHTNPASSSSSVGRSTTMPPSGNPDALDSWMSRLTITPAAAPPPTVAEYGDHSVQSVTSGMIGDDSQSSLPSNVLGLLGVPSGNGGGTISIANNDSDNQRSPGDDVELDETSSNTTVHKTPCWIAHISNDPVPGRIFACAVPVAWSAPSSSSVPTARNGGF